jgi:predicted DNA-binding transcriptional regulator YafY
MEGKGRFKRVLTLIALVEQGCYNTEDLVRLSGVSKRTLYRDLQLIKDCDVPLVFDRRQRVYRLRTPFSGPTPRLLPEEVRALFEAVRSLADPNRSTMQRALAKVRALLPDELRQVADESSNGHTTPPAPATAAY